MGATEAARPEAPEPCPACDGEATIVCVECRGSGQEWQSGGGLTPCFRCHGEGRTPCPDCDGTGRALPA